MNRSLPAPARTLLRVASPLFLLAILIVTPANAQPAASPPAPISFGTAVSGSISPEGEVDVYTFTASVDDMIFVSVGRESGSLWPRVRLYSPEGILLGDAAGVNSAELLIRLPELHRVFLPVALKNVSAAADADPAGNVPFEPAQAGVYKILVCDGFNGTLTGGYGVTVQRTNNPGNATPIALGQTLGGSVNVAGEWDSYTFSVNAGDKIFLAAGTSSGSLHPKIKLFGPDGNLLNETSGASYAEMLVSATAGGQHLVMLGDGFNGTLTGGYGVTVQRTNNPGNATPISPGMTLGGSVGRAGEADSFTFTASAGTNLLITMTTTSGSLHPRVRLYDPAGDLIADQTGTTQAQITRSAPVSGAYLIFANDGFNGTLTGGYNMNLQ